jgi:hypothetical protein
MINDLDHPLEAEPLLDGRVVELHAASERGYILSHEVIVWAADDRSGIRLIYETDRATAELVMRGYVKLHKLPVIG